jgi:hypothetical protein
MAWALRKGWSATNSIMKQKSLSTDGFESTYALLVRSENKERNMFEGAAYLALVLSAVFSIWQMVQQPITLPKGNVIHTTTVARSIENQRA